MDVTRRRPPAFRRTRGGHVEINLLEVNDRVQQGTLSERDRRTYMRVFGETPDQLQQPRPRTPAEWCEAEEASLP